MTEEINGYLINISDCKYFEGIGNCKITESLCVHNKTCYFKEIARLEQENKELKEKYSHVLELAKTNADSNEYCLQELEQENQKLLEARNHFMGVNLKYFNALEEIREIADKCKECLNEDDDCGCDYLRIKRRIDEVLGNENN